MILRALHELAGAICRTVKSVQMIQSAKQVALALKHVTRSSDFLWMAVRIWDC